MGKSLTPVPFWTDDIEIGRVLSASRECDIHLDGLALKDLGRARLNYASLYSIDDGTLHLVMRGGDFITFIEKR